QVNLYYTMISLRSFLFSRIRVPPSSTLFPYTTLFRSEPENCAVLRRSTIAFRSVRRRMKSPFASLILLDELVTLKTASMPSEGRSEEHTSELQSRENLVCRLLLEKKNNKKEQNIDTLD